MVKLTLLELPPAQSTCTDSPPEELEAVVNVVGLTSAGLETETFRVSGMATSDAAIAAISWWLLTKVVGRTVPFKPTIEFCRKLFPLTVSRNPGAPAERLVGEMELTDGVWMQSPHDSPTSVKAIDTTHEVLWIVLESDMIDLPPLVAFSSRL
jgi:hypothetical protein